MDSIFLPTLLPLGGTEVPPLYAAVKTVFLIEERQYFHERQNDNGIDFSKSPRKLVEATSISVAVGGPPQINGTTQ